MVNHKKKEKLGFSVEIFSFIKESLSGDNLSRTYQHNDFFNVYETHI